MSSKKRSHRLFILLIVFLPVFTIAGLGSYLYLSHRSEVQLNERQRQELTRLDDIIAQAKKNREVYVRLPGATQIKSISDDYTRADSLWVIVNKNRPIPKDYAPAHIAIPNVPTRPDKTEPERSVRSDVVKPIEALFSAAKTDGHDLMIGSAYRTAGLQQMYFDNYVANSGYEAATQFSALPGESEHQTGLAVDISTESKTCYLEECFTSTPDGEWLADNAYKFGFTLRYPEGKESVTGYNFEPWHFRYVGIDLATALKQSGLTLDEAQPYIQTARDTLHANGVF